MLRNRIYPSAVLLGFCALVALPAAANICGAKIDERAREEARLLESETFSAVPKDEATEIDWSNRRVYNSRIITCNRKRDGKGNKLEREIEASHNFAQNLDARTVKGHYSYQGLGIFSKLRYAYQIERRAGTWVVTVPIRFYLPTARSTDMIDIPFELAQEKGLDDPGGVCEIAATVFVSGNPRRVASGFIDNELTAEQKELLALDVAAAGAAGLVFPGKTEDHYLTEQYDVASGRAACRVRRDLIIDGLTAVDQLREYWREQIVRIWNRPGFEIVPVMIGRDNVSADDLAAWEIDETIWPMRFNLKPGHRASFKRWVAKWNNAYTGISGPVIAHELGHYLGLDDEYGESDSDKHCTTRIAATPTEYLMCSQWADRNGAQGLYPWLITRRYAIGKLLSCKQDANCDRDEYCDLGTLTLGRNYCKPKKEVGAGCTRPNICLSDLCPDGFCAECTGQEHCADTEYCDKGWLTLGVNLCESRKPNGSGCSRPAQCISGLCPAVDQKCAACVNDGDCGPNQWCESGVPGKANVCKAKIDDGGGCTRPLQCKSGLCPAPDFKCVECSNDGHCDSGDYCDQGTLRVGLNQCVSLKNNGVTCSRPLQCKSGLCPAPDFKCVECTNDGHCGSGEYCDEGTLSVGLNQCVQQKNDGVACSRPDQCKSGLCPAPDFKCVECTNDGHCSSSQYCDEGWLAIGFNQCVALKNDGAGCTRKEQCKSNICNTGFCAECTTDSHCNSNQYCDKGWLSVGKNQCKAEKNLDVSCSRDEQCRSKCCKGFITKKCKPSSDC